MTNDWLGFKAAVRGYLSDVVPTDGLYALAVAEYVKAKFAREVDHDLDFYNAYMQSYLVYRQRLLGYAHSNPTALVAAVQSLITIDANRQGTSDFLTAMIGQAREDIEGQGPSIDGLIQQGVIELESFIPIYRTGQISTFTVANLTQECQASKGALPVGAQVRSAYIARASDADADLEPLIMTSWIRHGDHWREDCDILPTNREHHDHRLCIDQWNVSFFIIPLLDATHQVKLVWDGIRMTFNPADVVTPPFDLEMAQVVAEYVKGHLARDVQKDYAMAAMILKPQVGSYYLKRRKLYLDAEDRQRNTSIHLDRRHCKEPAPGSVPPAPPAPPGLTPPPPPPTFDSTSATFDDNKTTFDQTP